MVKAVKKEIEEFVGATFDDRGHLNVAYPHNNQIVETTNLGRWRTIGCWLWFTDNNSCFAGLTIVRDTTQ
ncbi:MAG TPA: hypothetical protein VNX68_02405 [Nitrosopumilaceae archaeon]|jgi:hypothetical protein|nr:hypothetical protein [Nitrosopumilaceae archaeon]